MGVLGGGRHGMCVKGRAGELGQRIVEEVCGKMNWNCGRGRRS